MEALELKYLPIDSLVEYKKNPRANDKAVPKMVAAIKEYGFRVPILAYADGTVLDGHLRIKAARELGLGSVPVVLMDGLTDAQIKAFRLVVNRAVEWADWDLDLLAAEVKELQELDFDLNLTGFGRNEIAKLLRVDPKEAEAMERLGLGDGGEDSGEALSEPGTIWRLGDHRLMCGDSAKSGDVSALLDGVAPPICVTDPPYGVDYDPEWRVRSGFSRGVAAGKVLNDDRADWQEVWDLFPGDVIYSWCPSAQNALLIHGQALIRAGFDLRYLIIWAKDGMVISRGDYHHQFESCWYAVRRGGKSRWSGARDQSTVWRIANEVEGRTGHSTQKPIECMKRPIENNSKSGDYVYEPFSGSGTTIMACELTGRKCLAMELNPAYVDMTVRRWERSTGNRAERQE
jgi:DNA modification methylase